MFKNPCATSRIASAYPYTGVASTCCRDSPGAGAGGGAPNWPFAASNAAVSTAASSFGNRIRTSTIPSSRSVQVRARSFSWPIRDPSARRYPLTIRASCDAVAVRASRHNSASSTSPTTRVASRTFEYDNRPSRNAAATVDILGSALATRTCSRAVPGDIEQHHDNQCANDFTSFHHRIPFAASNSPINSINRQSDRADTLAAAQIRPAITSAVSRSTTVAFTMLFPPEKLF